MESVGELLKACMKGMQNEFTIYGHTFSWWQIFVFVIVASILTYIIGGILSE